MGVLRDRMVREMSLREFSASTQTLYLATLTDLARYHDQSPDTLDPTQGQNFLLSLTQERHLAWSSVSVAASAIRVFYTHTVKRLDLAMAMPSRRKPRRLPHILSVEEIERLLSTPRHPTHRVAIANHRITAVADGQVSFTSRARQHGGVIRTRTLPAESFLDRFLLHVVPPHFPRIRHVGFLANCTKKARLAQCRRLLNAAPPPAPPTRTTGEQLHALTGVDRSRCPHCDTGTMAIVARVPTVRDRPGVAATLAFEDSS